MLSFLVHLALASCATAPPPGQTCYDTAGSSGPIPDWILITVLAVIVILVVIVLIRMRRGAR